MYKYKSHFTFMRIVDLNKPTEPLIFLFHREVCVLFPGIPEIEFP